MAKIDLKLLKLFTKEYERQQEVFIHLYNRPNAFLAMQASIFENIKNSDQMQAFLSGNHAIFCDLRESLVKPIVNHSPAQNKHLNRRIRANIEYDRTKEDLQPFTFHYPDLKSELSSFNSSREIRLSPSSINSKIKLVSEALKLFPNAYIISLDSSFITRLMKRPDLEIGVLRARSFFKCTIGKPLPWEQRKCLETSMQCTSCRYHLDRLKCLRSHTIGMRPFTFLTEIRDPVYKPRALMIIDNKKIIENSLRKFFSYKNTSLKREIYLEKTLEKKGFMNLVQQLRDLPPVIWPSRPHEYYHETDEYLCRLLIKQGKSYMEGLNKKDRNLLKEIKQNISAQNMSKKSKIKYKTQGRICIPKDCSHLWDYIKTYSHYFLVLE